MTDVPRIRVGVIGLGAMGARIATRLVWEGFNPQVYDVVDIAVRMFTNDVGGMISGSPKMMAQTSDVIITVLPSAEILRDVLFGWEGLAGGFAPGGVVIDMGGAAPKQLVELADRLTQRGIHLIDAPALGTPADARGGQLTFIVGGDEEVVARCRPILDVLGSTVVRAGPVGSGQAGAALGDYLRAAQILAASEALRIAAGSGLDPKSVVEIGEKLSGLSPWMGALLRDEILSRRFATGLALGHVRQGLELASGVAQSAGAHSPMLEACREAWVAAEAGIGSGADQSQIVQWLESVVPKKPQETA